MRAIEQTAFHSMAIEFIVIMRISSIMIIFDIDLADTLKLHF